MAQNESSRETFSSSWGAVFATAGTAIGLGNIWRFPYMMGRYGGASFLALYVFIVVAFGIPALMSEWALGRQTRRGPLQAFRLAGMRWGRWFGYALLITVTMAASYYAVVIAWVLYYAWHFAFGDLAHPAVQVFSELAGNVWLQLFLLILTTGGGCWVLASGVRRGIERTSRYALPLFFLLFGLLALRVFTLDGAGEGLRYFFLPRWDQIEATTPLAALGQAFFSLALGGTFMLVYGSYMQKDDDIASNAVLTSAADLAAALIAGLIVVPSVVAFGIDLSSGPPLLFVTMPEVFHHLPAARVLGVTFFLSIFVVAMLSLIAAYEVVAGALIDDRGWRRGRILAVLFVVEVVLAVPSILVDGYVAKSDLIWGSTMQPIGGALAVIALAWFIGRGRTLSELRRNARLPIPTALYYWVKYAIPAGIASAIVVGWFF